MKLSKRLTQLSAMVTMEYDHVWDCCCDHGFLGAALLSKLTPHNTQRNTQIHFVDIVPKLMDELNVKLARFYPNASWKTHCIDVAHLPLASYKGKHLVIIAGVGGDLMINFIESIIQKYPLEEIEFLLCPVHHQFSLREKLNHLQFSLINEVLVEENKRFYEIMFVSSLNNKRLNISLVGDKIWQANTPEQLDIAKRYLQKTLSHYQRIQQGKQYNVEHIIQAYTHVNLV